VNLLPTIWDKWYQDVSAPLNRNVTSQFDCIEHINSAQYPHDQRKLFAPSLFCFRFCMFPSVISRMDIPNVISALWIITIDRACHLVGCFKEMFTGFSTLKQGGSKFLLQCEQLQATVLDKSQFSVFHLVWLDMSHITFLRPAVLWPVSPCYLTLNHTPTLLIHHFIEGWDSILVHVSFSKTSFPSHHKFWSTSSSLLAKLYTQCLLTSSTSLTFKRPKFTYVNACRKLQQKSVLYI